MVVFMLTAITIYNKSVCILYTTLQLYLTENGLDANCAFGWNDALKYVSDEIF